MTLPTFLIIGAMKAGTTSLWSYLGSHPDVFVAPEKELNFFVAERNWPKGIGWYAERFAAGSAPAIGEASPTYTMAHAFAGVPGRIAEVLPDVKLVYVVRDPIERMRSHFLHRVASGKEERPLERALLEGLAYLHTSRYAFQLEQYLEHFDRGRILLVRAEDLRAARLETLKRVFAFLEVDPEIVPSGIDVEEHRTEEKQVRSPAARRIGATPVARRLASVTPRPVRRWLAGATTRKLDGSVATVPPALRRRIAEGLRPDLERLRTIAGPGFDPWGLL